MAFYQRVSDRSNFVISWTFDPKNDFGVFAQGYTSAANRLASTLLEASRFSDYDAYPVVFLYRHALELSLKHVIYRCAQLGALRHIEKIGNELYNNHHLPKLMNAAAASLELLFPNDALLSSLIPRCRLTCDELTAIDPDSFAFRYPMDRKGRHSTAKHLVLNLSSFCQHMSPLLEELDTVHFGLSGEIDIAEDALYMAIHSQFQSTGEPCGEEDT